MTLIAPKPQALEALSHADKQIIASVLTWDCQRDVAPEEIETIAIVHDIVWVKLSDNRAIPVHVETFRLIRRQQLEQQTVDDVEYVTQLEAKLEADEIEVDSTKAGIYRVWKGMNLIGTVRRCKYTMCWLALSSTVVEAEPYLTSDLAIAAVKTAWEGA